MEGDVAQKSDRFNRLKVTNSRPWKERHSSRWFPLRVRKLQNLAIIRFEWINFEVGEVSGQLGGGLKKLRPGDIDWDRALDGAGWFHITGITPALSASAADLSLEGVKAFRNDTLAAGLSLKVGNVRRTAAE